MRVIQKFLISLSFLTSFTSNFAQQKTFIITSSASSDYLGAWWYNKLKKENPKLTAQAIGGKKLNQANIPIWKNYTQLTIGTIGTYKFIKKFINQWDKRNKITKHILDNNFTNVVIVDTVISGILIARTLKKQKPEIKITYIAPPEMWLWGRWGIDKLFKNYCDKLIVLYPFEPEWYAKHNLNAQWLGWPYYKDFEKYLNKNVKKEKKIALFPGSRLSEIKTMIPLFAKVVRRFKQEDAGVKFIMPVAQTFTFDKIKKILQKYDVENYITLIADDKDYSQLQSCCLAITKPGTITLKLGILQIPTIVAYKAPWIFYLFMNSIIQKPYISLTNILLNKMIQPQLIQSDCNAKNIFEKAKELYLGFLENNQNYKENIKQLEKIKKLLKQ